MANYRDKKKKLDFSDIFRETEKKDRGDKIYEMAPIKGELGYEEDGKPYVYFSEYRALLSEDAAKLFEKDLRDIFKNDMLFDATESEEIIDKAKIVIDKSHKLIELARKKADGLRPYLETSSYGGESLKEKIEKMLGIKKEEGKLYLDDLIDLERIDWDKVPNDIDIKEERDFALDLSIDESVIRRETFKENKESEEKASFRVPGTDDHIIGDRGDVEAASSKYKMRGWSNEELEYSKDESSEKENKKTPASERAPKPNRKDKEKKENGVKQQVHNYSSKSRKPKRNNEREKER